MGILPESMALINLLSESFHFLTVLIFVFFVVFWEVLKLIKFSLFSFVSSSLCPKQSLTSLSQEDSSPVVISDILLFKFTFRHVTPFQVNVFVWCDKVHSAPTYIYPLVLAPFFEDCPFPMSSLAKLAEVLFLDPVFVYHSIYLPNVNSTLSWSLRVLRLGSTGLPGFLFFKGSWALRFKF